MCGLWVGGVRSVCGWCAVCVWVVCGWCAVCGWVVCDLCVVGVWSLTRSLPSAPTDYRKCTASEFRCHSGQCVDRDVVCYDGKAARGRGCYDNSHLINCSKFITHYLLSSLQLKQVPHALSAFLSSTKVSSLGTDYSHVSNYSKFLGN